MNLVNSSLSKFVAYCICQISFLLLSRFIGANTEGLAYTRNQNKLSNLDKTPPCDSPIYCIGGSGTLLHTVQMSRLYNDSKTFVDKPLKHGPNQTLANFRLFMQVMISSLVKNSQPYYYDRFLTTTLLWYLLFLFLSRNIGVTHQEKILKTLSMITFLRKELNSESGFQQIGKQMLLCLTILR